MITFKEFIEKSFIGGETWTDIDFMTSNLTNEVLNQKVEADGPYIIEEFSIEFTIWTHRRIYFPVTSSLEETNLNNYSYEENYYEIESVPRYPIDIPTLIDASH